MAPAAPMVVARDVLERDTRGSIHHGYLPLPQFFRRTNWPTLERCVDGWLIPTSPNGSTCDSCMHARTISATLNCCRHHPTPWSAGLRRGVNGAGCGMLCSRAKVAARRNQEQDEKHNFLTRHTHSWLSMTTRLPCPALE